MQIFIFNNDGWGDWCRYIAVALLCIAVVVACSVKLIIGLRSIGPLKSREGNDRWRVVPVAVHTTLWLGTAALFVYMFYKVIICEPVQRVCVGHERVCLLGRWRWQSVTIPRKQIVSAVVVQKNSLRRTYKIARIVTKAKVYVIDPMEIGHDDTINRMVQCVMAPLATQNQTRSR